MSVAGVARGLATPPMRRVASRARTLRWMLDDWRFIRILVDERHDLPRGSSLPLAGRSAGPGPDSGSADFCVETRDIRAEREFVGQNLAVPRRRGSQAPLDGAVPSASGGSSPISCRQVPIDGGRLRFDGTGRLAESASGRRNRSAVDRGAGIARAAGSACSGPRRHRANTKRETGCQTAAPGASDRHDYPPTECRA